MSRKTFFTTQEVGDILGVKKETASMWANRNGVGKQKLGNHYVFMFTRDDIKRYHQGQKKAGCANQKKISIPY